MRNVADKDYWMRMKHNAFLWINADGVVRHVLVVSVSNTDKVVQFLRPYAGGYAEFAPPPHSQWSATAISTYTLSVSATN